MAFLKKYKKSPYWFLSYVENGKRFNVSTKLLTKYPNETKKARQLCAEKTLAEIKTGSVGKEELWQNWVPDYLRERYYGKDITYNTIKARWEAVEKFFKEKSIITPRHVTYQVCMDYLKWRTRKPEKGFHQASRNTAIHELKNLSTIMRHAQQKLGFIQVNPVEKLGLKKDSPDEKPEMTDEEIFKIRDALKNPKKYFIDHDLWLSDKDRDWMMVAFEIAIHQGCRLREVSIDKREIDLNKGTITFDAKGDNRFTTKLHPDLILYLREIFKDYRMKTCDIPPLPSKIWWRFFRKLKLGHLCFHCCRVTVITRLARAGVSMSEAMRYVGHASETIHRVYQRLKVDDLGRCVDALKFEQRH